MCQTGERRLLGKKLLANVENARSLRSVIRLTGKDVNPELKIAHVQEGRLDNKKIQS